MYNLWLWACLLKKKLPEAKSITMGMSNNVWRGRRTCQLRALRCWFHRAGAGMPPDLPDTRRCSWRRLNKTLSLSGCAVAVQHSQAHNEKKKNIIIISLSFKTWQISQDQPRRSWKLHLNCWWGYLNDSQWTSTPCCCFKSHFQGRERKSSTSEEGDTHDHGAITASMTWQQKEKMWHNSAELTSRLYYYGKRGLLCLKKLSGLLR